MRLNGAAKLPRDRRNNFILRRCVFVFDYLTSHVFAPASWHEISSTYRLFLCVQNNKIACIQLGGSSNSNFVHVRLLQVVQKCYFLWQIFYCYLSSDLCTSAAGKKNSSIDLNASDTENNLLDVPYLLRALTVTFLDFNAEPHTISR